MDKQTEINQLRQSIAGVKVIMASCPFGACCTPMQSMIKILESKIKDLEAKS